jgi:hypothetical protein
MSATYQIRRTADGRDGRIHRAAQRWAISSASHLVEATARSDRRCERGGSDSDGER